MPSTFIHSFVLRNNSKCFFFFLVSHPRIFYQSTPLFTNCWRSILRKSNACDPSMYAIVYSQQHRCLCACVRETDNFWRFCYPLSPVLLSISFAIVYQKVSSFLFVCFTSWKLNVRSSEEPSNNVTSLCNRTKKNLSLVATYQCYENPFEHIRCTLCLY